MVSFCAHLIFVSCLSTYYINQQTDFVIDNIIGERSALQNPAIPYPLKTIDGDNKIILAVFDSFILIFTFSIFTHGNDFKILLPKCLQRCNPKNKYFWQPAHVFLGLMFVSQFYRSVRADSYFGKPAFVSYDCLFFEDKNKKQSNFWPCLFVFLTTEGFYFSISFLLLVYQFFLISLYFAFLMVYEYIYLKDF